jgi:hypothetical protein
MAKKLWLRSDSPCTLISYVSKEMGTANGVTHMLGYINYCKGIIIQSQ